MASNAIQMECMCTVPTGMVGDALRLRWATRERLRGPITGTLGSESALLTFELRGAMPPH